ncbi:hypothetical protein O181_030549 [Austropuccinia psidii MF-1]|uniref:Uncharacterized protein n=1 Tax=Austropuccinia psidii MF-1 TaxID=1389203 RepID=A0A9Q3CU72_9BASI|nr:hypothetical protein [Austropuccinia psidii MF-1]
MILDPLNGPRLCGGILVYGPFYWSHGPPGAPAYLGPGDSNSHYRPWTAGYGPQSTNCGPRPMDHKAPKPPRALERPKMGLDHIFAEMAMVMTRTNIHQNGPKWPQSHFGPFSKDNQDKTPPLLIQNFKSREEGPKKSIWKSHDEIYVHILIDHHFLRRRALWPSSWDKAQGQSI